MARDKANKDNDSDTGTAVWLRDVDEYVLACMNEKGFELVNRDMPRTAFIEDEAKSASACVHRSKRVLEIRNATNLYKRHSVTTPSFFSSRRRVARYQTMNILIASAPALTQVTRS